MLKNYFKIAWRNLQRNKTFSIINVAGLSIGMACTLLILLWVYNEYHWDRSNRNYDNIYHAMANRNFNGEVRTGPDMMYPLAATARARFPEIHSSAVVSFGDNILFTVGEKIVRRNTLTVSPEFFKIFTPVFLKGSPEALNDLSGVVITKSTAEALFGNMDVLGQQVKLNNNRTWQVSAVVDDVIPSSTVQYDALIPFDPSSTQIKEAQNDWVNCGNRVFFRLQDGADPSRLETKLITLIRENTESENPTTRGGVVLHPMKKWRLHEEFTDGHNTGGRIRYVNLFTWIAVVILVIACVNFMNLSTARSEKRAREVGIRKTLGSPRKQLIFQFIAESLLLAILAFVLAIGLVFLSLPAFERLLNTDVPVPYNDPLLWLVLGGIIVVSGLVAGAYPAFYLSGFRPVRVLKGLASEGKPVLMPRKILVTAQFIASIVLISATFIIYQQLNHVQQRDTGYNQENLLMVTSSSDVDRNIDAIRNDLIASGYVTAVGRTSAPVTTMLGFTSGIRWKGAAPKDNLVIGFSFADQDYATSVGAHLLQGRDFRQGDSNTVMFNKEAIRLMGMENPVGSTINWAGRERRIVGVLDDMIVLSPYEKPGPMMVAYEDRWSRNLHIRIKSGVNVRKAVDAVEKTYRKHSPSFPFEFQFVDENFNRKFINEQLIGKLSLIFSGLAIFICCLGLFGLVAFTIEKRNKEIGIRKVLGASVRQILLLMSKEFLLLVAFAFLVAIPLAWWAMNSWLENFEYRVSIGIGIFLVVGLIILAIALITVSLNASRAALKNPVKTLRSE